MYSYVIKSSIIGIHTQIIIVKTVMQPICVMVNRTQQKERIGTALQKDQADSGMKIVTVVPLPGTLLTLRVPLHMAFSLSPAL